MGPGGREGRRGEGTTEASGGCEERRLRSQGGEGKGKDKGAARGGNGGGSVLASLASDIHGKWRLANHKGVLHKCQVLSRLDTALEGSRTLTLFIHTHQDWFLITAILILRSIGSL